MRYAVRNFTESLNIVNHYGAEAITTTELNRNDGDPYKAVVTKKLELTGKIETLENRIEAECDDGITVFQEGDK